MPVILPIYNTHNITNHRDFSAALFHNSSAEQPSARIECPLATAATAGGAESRWGGGNFYKGNLKKLNINISTNVVITVIYYIFY